jgi:hypothetical protein
MSEVIVKAQVVFDATGKVVAMYHMPSVRPDAKHPIVTLRPQAGQDLAILDIPDELCHLEPQELHASIYVDRRGDSPRLALKPKT